MIEWIVSSSALIAVIIALRYILKGKISLRLQYALWGLVLLRLLIPFSIGSSGISIMNALPDSVPETILPVGIPDGAYSSGSTAPGQPVFAVPDTPSTGNVQSEPVVVYSGGVMDGNVKVTDWGGIAKMIWFTGIAVVGLWLLISNLRLAGKLRKSRQALEVEGCRLPVYLSNAVDTPCLFGIFRPSIYVTPEAAESESRLRHILAHEVTHCRHGDNFWAVLRGACLALHWYNPLVWWAAVLSSNDAELACDEATIQRIGESERAEYGRTLISMTCQKRPALLTAATTMTGSRSSIKERITLIARKPKMAAYTLIAVVLIAVVAVGCTFTGAKDGDAAGVDDTVIAGSPEPTAEPTITPGNEDDKPTIPENLPPDMEYLYDFRFSERYDNRVTPDFSLTSRGSTVAPDGTLSLFEQYQEESETENTVYDGDGMVPHLYRQYRHVFQQGTLVIRTDYYEPDNVEYISYLWTDLEGVQTNRAIAVGSSEAELLQAYTSDLYFLEQGDTEPSVLAMNEETNVGVCDYAYAWQPFTQESNEIRDITFYMKDGVVAAIEIMEPYELRYVYGYDRAVGLESANTKRLEVGSTNEMSTVQNGDVTISQNFMIEEDVKNFAIENTTELRNFLSSLDYHSYTCDGLPEYDILFDDGTMYYVNLSSRWVWQGNKEKEADLSEDLLDELQTLLGIG